MKIGQHWLGKSNPKHTFRSTQNAFKKLQKKNIILMEFSTDWPTN